jgi:hypothetical protein
LLHRFPLNLATHHWTQIEAGATRGTLANLLAMGVPLVAFRGNPPTLRVPADNNTARFIVKKGVNPGS